MSKTDWSYCAAPFVPPLSAQIKLLFCPLAQWPEKRRETGTVGSLIIMIVTMFASLTC